MEEGERAGERARRGTGRPRSWGGERRRAEESGRSAAPGRPGEKEGGNRPTGGQKQKKQDGEGRERQKGGGSQRGKTRGAGTSRGRPRRGETGASGRGVRVGREAGMARQAGAEGGQVCRARGAEAEDLRGQGPGPGGRGAGEALGDAQEAPEEVPPEDRGRQGGKTASLLPGRQRQHSDKFSPSGRLERMGRRGRD